MLESSQQELVKPSRPGSSSSKNRVHPKDIVPDKSEHDQKKDEDQEIQEVSFCELFRFATKFDIALIIFGSIAAAATGAALPIFSLLWGQMVDSFSDADQMVEQSRQILFYFIALGGGVFFTAWIMFACWMIAGERQGIACRKAYLRSLLGQEIAWFDVTNQMELASKFATDSFAFQGAIGEKISTLIMTLSMFVSGFAIAFATGWLLSFVVLAVIPGLIISGAAYMMTIASKDQYQQKNYSKAGGKAEQAISSIKTVKQLNGEEFQSLSYTQTLQEAGSSACKYAIYSGLGLGSIFLVMLASYSLGFWYGAKCVMGSEECPQDVSGQKYTAGDVLVIFMGILMAGFNLSQFAPTLKKISEGKQAAKRIYAIIDRVPQIKNPENGIKLDKLEGKICFENVTFAYPKDKSYKIFDNLSMEIDQNSVGFVGESGSGKSTAMQLILRFYDPDQGRITLDGVDLKKIDLYWLRNQFGYVGQQPVLFATSIRQNLMFGNQNATQAEINDALKKAQAYEFVYQLEDKLETYVGFGGGQLSGGQKQRIAIARAILRKPQILLLDEATSALDRKNEKLIQQTLTKISEDKKTITIAHRIKTIMNCNKIYVFEKGGLKETGKFNELVWFKEHQHQLNQQEKEVDVPMQIENTDKNPEVEKKEEKEAQVFKTKQQIEKEQNKKLVEKYEDDIFSRIFIYSQGKLCYFAIGILFSLANGVVFPIFSIFFARLLNSLLIISIDKTNQKEMDEINFYALLFLILGIAAFILTTFQNACMTIVGEHITRSIRIETFRKIMKMPLFWFDDMKNNPGALTSRLSADCQKINGVTTTSVAIMLQNISSLVSGIVIAFVFEWRTALVALGLLPFMIISGIIEMSLTTGFSDKTDAAYKQSSSLIMESMINIRTVSSFGYQSSIANKFDLKMVEPYQLAVKKGNVSGLLYGFSQFIMFLIFGLLFFIGALFVRDNAEVSVEDMFTAVFGIMFAGMTAGNNAHFMPDMAVCNSAAANIFFIQDSKDEEQLQEEQKSQMLKEGINGDIELKDIHFKYENRKEYVFTGLNLKIEKGKKVAFVGSSGCGKSTILQLLQRFYFPEKGTITINGIDIKDFDIHYLRQKFGVVSQEPTLFEGSFRFNIEYNLGKRDMAEIQKVAEKANALSFIKGNEKILEDDVEINQSNQGIMNNENVGFEKNVGVKGSHISGGQKQRIAIARVIIRGPEILLLDEATSALDRDNEKIVQDSLDSLMENKTCITVAHRIETIKNSNTIHVFEKGKIVESGDFNQLMSMKGAFYKIEKGINFV